MPQWVDVGDLFTSGRTWWLGETNSGVQRPIRRSVMVKLSPESSGRTGFRMASCLVPVGKELEAVSITMGETGGR